MNRTLTIALLLTFTSINTLYAQFDTLLLVRENHKLGYIKYWRSDNSSAMEITPQFDAISEEFLPWQDNYMGDKKRSPFKLFEQNGKLGLLDINLNIILPAQYKRIRALNQRYFSVVLDSLFTVVYVENDSTIISVLNGACYDNIVPDNYNNTHYKYFKVKTGKNWGIHESNGQLVVKPNYQELKWAGYGDYFKVKKNKKDLRWRLIGLNGKEIFNEEFMDIKVLSPEVFFIKTTESPNFWRLKLNLASKKEKKLDTQKLKQLEGFVPALNKDELLKGSEAHPSLFQYRNVSLLNSRLALLETLNATKADSIYDLILKRPWDTIPNIRSYLPLDENYIIGVTKLGDKVIIDNKGEVLTTPLQYDSIIPINIENTYIVATRNNFGIISLKSKLHVSLPCVYDSITPQESGLLVLYIKDQGYGLISIKDSCLNQTGCIFDKIIPYKNSILYAEVNKALFTLNCDSLNCKIEKRALEGHVGGTSKFKPFIEASGTDITQWVKVPQSRKIVPSQIFTPRKGDNSPLVVQGELIHLNLENNPTLNAIRFSQCRLLNDKPDQPILALYLYQTPVKNGFTKKILSSGLAGILLYDVSNKRLLLDGDTILGFRRFQTNVEYTTIVHKNGEMSLVNRTGQLKKDVLGKTQRFTFIGPFLNGASRVCIGGYLDLIRKDLAPKITEESFGILNLSDFFDDLNLKNGIETEIESYSQESFYYARPINLNGKISSPLWGYIDSLGSYIKVPQYEFADDFGEDQTAFIYKTNPDKPNDEDIYNTYFGAIKSNGETILPIEYNPISRMDKVFSNYFLIAKENTPTFFFDNKGRMLLENQTKPTPFSEGMAAFKDTKSRWGFIDTSGHIKIEPIYMEIGDPMRVFSEGLGLVLRPEGDWVFIDKDGQFRCKTGLNATDIKQDETSKMHFSSGLCPIKRGTNWGYINEHGTDTIAAIYKSAEPFSDDAAIVQTINDDSNELEFWVINCSGKRVAGPYDFISTFNNSKRARFKNNKNLWGLLNNKGDVVVPPIYKNIGPFENGFAAATNEKQGLKGLINIQGDTILPFIYLEIGNVSDGVVKTKKKDKWEYWHIDTILPQMLPISAQGYSTAEDFVGGITLVNGNTVITKNGDELFKSVSDLFFSEGILGSKNAGLFMDGYGENLFPTHFLHVKPFRNSVAVIVKEKSKTGFQNYGAINKRGVLIVPPKYEFIAQQVGGTIIVNPNRLYGLADKNGRILIPPIYDRLIYYDSLGVFRGEYGEKIEYGRISSNKTWESIWKLKN